jgi:hypothetical protein
MHFLIRYKYDRTEDKQILSVLYIIFIPFVCACVCVCVCV